MTGKFEAAMTVQFNDVDVENRLTLKGTARLMQETVNLHSESAHQGLNYLDELGFSWVLRQQRCILYRRPGWNTHLSVRTWSHGMDGIMAMRDFDMRDEEGNLVAAAATSWLPMNLATGHMLKPDGSLIAGYCQSDDHVFREPLGRLSGLPDAQKVWEYRVQKRDIDINRHVNNLVYLDYAMEVVPEDVDPGAFDEAEVLYRKSVWPGEIITFYTGWEDENSLVTAVKDAEGKSTQTVIRLRRHPEGTPEPER